MREPFEYPTHCTGPDMEGIVVDIRSLLYPPMCSFTGVVSATADPIPIEFCPEIPNFVMCPCIPTIKQSEDTTGILAHTYAPNLDMVILPVPKSGTAAVDCCDPTFKLTAVIDIPCLPLKVTGTGGFHAEGNSVNVSATRLVGGEGADACALELKIDIPCLPLKVTGTGGFHAEGNSVKVSATRLVGGPGDDACALGLQIEIPCLPLKVTGTGGFHAEGNSVNVSATRLVGGEGDDACALGLKIDIPCLPLNVTGTGGFHAEGNSVNVSATRIVGGAGDDACALGLKIDIPCLPLKVTGTGAFHAEGDSIKVSATRIVDGEGDDACALGLKIEIPCLPLKVTSTGKFVADSDTVKMSATRIVDGQGDDACALGFQIEIPCLPLKVTGTGTFHAEGNSIKISATRIVDGQGADACALGLQIELPCLPLKVTGTGAVRSDITVPVVSATREVGGAGDDACALKFKLNVPCMPLKFDATFGIYGPGNLSSTASGTTGCTTLPAIGITVVKNGGAELAYQGYDFDVAAYQAKYDQVKCENALETGIPDANGLYRGKPIFKAGSVFAFANDTSPGSPDQGVAFALLNDNYKARGKASAYGYSEQAFGDEKLDFYKPTGIWYNPSYAGYLEKGGGNCAFDLELNIPCMPMGVTGKLTWLEPDEDFKLSATRLTTGEHADKCVLELDFQIPKPDAGAMTITTDISGIFTQISGCTGFTGSFGFEGTSYYITAEKKNCLSLKFNYLIQLPRQGQLV